MKLMRKLLVSKKTDSAGCPILYSVKRARGVVLPTDIDISILVQTV
jgi:hypothetical protein